MNEVEKSAYLAEHLMGWYLQDEMVRINTGEKCRGYFNKSGLIVYEEDWTPFTRIDQALGDGGPGTVVGEMKELHYRLFLVCPSITEPNNISVGFCHISHSYPRRYFKDVTAAAAICEAAYQVLKEKNK